MRTSPLPPVNVVRASRPDLGWTETFLNRSASLALAWSGELPSLRNAPYAAMTFHLAEPEEKTFGVTTSTPGLSRSSQLLMPFGLPLRTTRVATESVIMPLWGWEVQFLSTR